ncbi:centromere protein M [Mixophyes fleayi]|uniref:centromere protein M n=1 Tax=Mixophyes fleayi TaxID=3061075 RepID=UPI003F4DFC6A
MATLRPYDKMPMVNAAAILLVGSEESHLELMAGAMLKEPKTFEVKIHTAPALPLPYERDPVRPRFDMVVFIINRHSQRSLARALSSITHLDAHYFHGRVCFVATKGGQGQMQHCVVDTSTVRDLADSHLSVLVHSELDHAEDVVYTARRLLNMLKVCAGLVPGFSSLYMGTIAKRF